MFLDAIRQLYDYQREVTGHVLDVSAELSNEEFTSIIVEGQPSIRDTLFHFVDVVETHFAWWSFSTNRQAPELVERLPEQFNDAESIRIYWADVDQKVTRLIGSLESDDQLESPYVRAFADGSENKRLLWEMMLHVVNHGTQQRSEVALMLTILGHSPADMEIL